MSVPHRKLSSASTASTSSLRQVPDFEPDDRWKAATQKTIEDSLRFMIKEAKEELQRKLDAEPNISSEQRAACIEDYKRTENGIRKLAQEEFEHAVHKERMERRWAAGQAIPNQISEALRSEQQTILDSIQKSASGGDPNTVSATTSNPAPLSSPAPQAGASKPPDPRARIPTRHYSQQDSSDSSEDDFGEESDHLPNHSERGKDSPFYRSFYEPPIHPSPQADRNAPKNHQIWKPSISPEDDALADSPHVIGRQVGRRASMTSIKSTGSLSFRPPSGHNAIPEFSEEVEHDASNSEREKAQTRLAEQQWSTLNRARDKDKTNQRSTPIDGRRGSVNDNNMRTPSPMTSGPTSPPPLPPLSTKPIYRPSSQASLLSASRPPAEPYPSPASANRYSGSNYGSEGPQRFQPPQIKPSDSSDSTFSYEGPPPEQRYGYYGPSSYEEQRSYPTPSSSTRVSFPRRESDHYPPYRGQEYPRPDSGASFRPPSGPPYQDYNDYRRPPSSGPEGPMSPAYDYPTAVRRGWPIPDPVSYTGPYAPNYYDPGIPFTNVSRRGSTSESYRSRGSLEQGDEAWRYWKAERSTHHEGGNRSDHDDDLSDLEEDEHEEARQREEDKRRSDEEARKKEAKQQEEEARKKAEARKRQEEEARKRQEEIRQREEEEARKREEEARKKEEEARKREEEARKREEEEALKRKEEEIRQKEADAHKKEEDIKRKEEQAKKKEAEVKKKEAAAKKKEAEVKKKEADAQRREAEAARKAEEYQRREEEVKAKEEELRKREEELRRKEREIKEREIEERRREEEKRRQQEEEEKRRQQEEEEKRRDQEEEKRREQEELERLADIGEQKRLWQQHENRREQEAKKEEQRRLEEFRRQQSDAAWNNLEAQKQKQEEKRRKEAEFERRQQDIHRRHEERQRQDSLGSGSDGIWPGSPTSTLSSASSASSNTSRTTATSATSASSGTPPSWTTWASSTPTSQPPASSRPSSQATPTPTSKSPPNMSHASTPNAKSRTGGEPPPVSQEEWQRRQEELARKQQEKFRLEQERLERERLQRAGTMLTKDDIIRLFDAHSRMWASLRAQANSELRWDSFPWPMIKKPSGPDDITYAAVDAYVFSPYYPETDSNKSDKDRVKEHIRKWHPDRFDTKWLPNVVKKDQSLVKEGAGQVVRYLNDLLAKKNSPGLFS